jgi:hypothetical protein
MFHEVERILRFTRGTLAERPMPLLLHALQLSKRTCGLELKRLALEKLILFEEGTVVGCNSNLVQETLGKYLVTKGLLEEDKSVKLLALAAKKGRRFEEILLREKILDAQALEKHTHGNLAHKILDCFRWTDAQYRIVGDVDIPPSPPRMSTVQLIYTGIITAYPADQITPQFPYPAEQRFALVQQPIHPLGELKLAAKDASFIEALRWRASIANLCAMAGGDLESVVRRLYALAILG